MTEPMKGVIIMLVAFVLTFFMVKCADAASNPSWDENKYVEIGRFETTKMSGTIDSIVTDTKTGCQYMVIFQSSITILGCWDEYKKPESK